MLPGRYAPVGWNWTEAQPACGPRQGRRDGGGRDIDVDARNLQRGEVAGIRLLAEEVNAGRVELQFPGNHLPPAPAARMPGPIADLFAADHQDLRPSVAVQQAFLGAQEL